MFLGIEGGTRNSRRRKNKTRIELEQLEARNLMAGFTPAQINHAYGFDQISYSNGINGTGQTIAIVDAFDDPTIQSDLHTFDVTYGLADPVFTKFTPQGTPAQNTGWDLEIALDVEWAHAIAPGAAIDLVESLDNSTANLYAADVYAAGLTGVSVVSNSWGGSEYSSEAGDDKNFVTPTGHQGVTFVFSSGDSGAPAEYPSASPNVLSVGGTTLTLDSNNNWSSETGWGSGFASRFFGGSGGGPSRFESIPNFQKGTVSGTKRGTPDVAFDANPNTGVDVFDSNNGGSLEVGGTSVGAPSWAGLIAIVNQGRAVSPGNLSSLKGSDLLSQIYKVSSNDFHDITSGNNGYRVGTGYDFVTGRGSPKANLLIPDLVATVASSSPRTTTTTTTTPVTTHATRPRIIMPDPTLVNQTPAPTTRAPDLARNIQAFFIQPVTPQGSAVPNSLLTAAPSGSFAASLSQALTSRSSAFLGGSSTDTLADEEPLDVMPASFEQEKAAPASPAAPSSEQSSSVKPMTDKAVDVFFMEPTLVVDPAESPAGNVAPNQEESAPGVELQSGTLGFVAIVGSFWAVRTAREEEKRPALRR
jgi:hypothetical protein